MYKILIIAGSKAVNQSHDLWLYNLIQVQLRSVLPDAVVSYGSYNNSFDLIIGYELSKAEKSRLDTDGKRNWRV